MTLSAFVTTVTATEAAPERLERHLRLPFALPHTPATFNVQRLENEYDMHRLFSANLYHRVLCPELQWTRYVPDLAADFPKQMDEEGLVWQIEIQQGYTFDDGRVIDAHVFEYSQKMLIDPVMLWRNENAWQIVGGLEYLRGEIEWDEVEGFKVLDDYTIQITYTPEGIPQLGAFHVMERYGVFGSAIVHPELYESLFNEDRTENTWGTTPEHFIASGVYRISAFMPEQYLEIEKRENGSPISDTFTADRISFYIAPNEDTQWMLFDSGQLDQTRANSRRFDEYPDLFYYSDAFIYGIFLNPFSESNPILQDINFRRALYWGLDRERIVRAAYPTALPQAYLYPRATRMRDVDFRENAIQHPYRDSEGAQSITINGHELSEFGFEPERALAYFELAYTANGSVPLSFEVQYTDGGEADQIWAEAIQESWQNLFGADRLQINLVAVPFQVALDNLQRTTMTYEIVAARRIWQIIDNEPWWNTNWITTGHRDSYPTQYCVLTPWAQITFTALFDLAFTNFRNQQLRNEISAIVEQLLLNDHTFLPMYQTRDRLLFSPWLSSILEVGHFDFRAGDFQFVWDDELYAEMKDW